MAEVLSLSDAAISLRLLARETRKYGEPELSEAGEALRQYIAGWIGEPAEERAIAAGVARLAHVIQFFEGEAQRPRPVIRATLRDIGLVSARGGWVGLSTDQDLDDWCTWLLLMADISGGHDSVLKRSA
jgi:hypothetical protein